MDQFIAFVVFVLAFAMIIYYTGDCRKYAGLGISDVPVIKYSAT